MSKYWFYRFENYPLIFLSRERTGGTQEKDWLVAIELQSVGGKFYLDIWFLNEYQPQKILFEEKLTQFNVEYHSANHLPNCYALKLDGSSAIDSPRITDFNELNYQEFVRVLLDFLKVTDIEKNRLREFLTNSQWFSQK